MMYHSRENGRASGRIFTFHYFSGTRLVLSVDLAVRTGLTDDAVAQVLYKYSTLKKLV